MRVQEGAISLDLMLQVARAFALLQAAAKTIVRAVGHAVAGWRQAAEAHGARPAEI